ncbi:unnamed protein product [Arabis nemorensis]|uniref:NYN domain-containing protein n=1 Tax=Arabis nemorensis TaxID=586526 RepID=A0A565C1Z8_9BRAS|nr:unnamed protein product [Arabis nemorensis]
MENPATYFEPLDLMVISQNIKQGSDFLHALEALQDRYYNLVLVLSHELSTTTELPIVYWECLLMYLHHGRDHDWYYDQGTFQRLVHKPKSIEETGHLPKGIVHVYSGDDNCWAGSDILVFWNAEDSINRVYDLYCHINRALNTKGYLGKVSIMAYTDNKEFTIPYGSYALEKLTKGDDGYAKVTRMFLDMLFLVMNKDEPTHFIMISRPSQYIMTKWANVVRPLEARGSNVILGASDAIQLPFSIDSLIRLCKDGPRFS